LDVTIYENALICRHWRKQQSKQSGWEHSNCS